MGWRSCSIPSATSAQATRDARPPSASATVREVAAGPGRGVGGVRGGGGLGRGSERRRICVTMIHRSLHPALCLDRMALRPRSIFLCPCLVPLLYPCVYQSIDTEPVPVPVYMPTPHRPSLSLPCSLSQGGNRGFLRAPSRSTVPASCGQARTRGKRSCQLPTTRSTMPSSLARCLRVEHSPAPRRCVHLPKSASEWENGEQKQVG